jgi:beta-phosphoglucomutase
MISAVVFDFDGVLADSEPLHLRAYQQVLSSLGAGMTAEEYCSRYLGFDDDGVFRLFAADRGWALSDDQIAKLISAKCRVLDALLAESDVLYRGASACVERLRPVYPLGIASGALKHEIEGILRPSGLLHYFHFIVASGDTEHGKPAPDPYRRAAQLHGVPAHACVAIEDSRWGIDSARAAGLACIAVTHTYPRHELSHANLVIDSLDELTPALIQSLA